jgi:internalin A
VKHFLLICAVVALVGCGGKKEAESPTVEITDPIVEQAVREELKKPTGELTKADMEKVTRLGIENKNLTDVPEGLGNLSQLTYLSLALNQLTDVKGLENLTQLEGLYINKNPDLTKAQIDELKKALPNCKILSNPKK